MKRAVVFFAKEPVPGTVKTRMGVELSPDECAALAAALIQDTADLIRSLEDVTPVLAYAPVEGLASLNELVGQGFEYVEQSDGDLGHRMNAVFEWSLSRGFSQTVIIGADSPAIPSEWIESAFSALNDRHVVLGPTLDGGYYLIGLSNTEPSLFSGIEWSTDSVMSATLDIIERLDLTLHLLPPWSDLDRPEDLRFYRSHIRALKAAGMRFPRHSERFLNKLRLRP